MYRGSRSNAGLTGSEPSVGVLVDSPRHGKGVMHNKKPAGIKADEESRE